MVKVKLGKLKSVWRLLAVVSLLTLMVSVLQVKYAKAACPAVSAPNGSVTGLSFTVTTAGTYRVWSRIMPADTINNSYTLDIDGTTCGVVVGNNSSLAAGNWSWVDYQNATQGTSTASKINVTLSAGTHTINMYGTEPGVGLDRIMFISDTTCTPNNNIDLTSTPKVYPGDNCVTVADTTPPTVSISSPANGATVSGTTTVSATAADAGTGITKVEFKLDGVLKTTDSTGPSPYTYALDTSTLSVGNHTLVATAYDGATNSASSATVTVNVADTVAPAVSLTSPTAGTKSGTISLAATATDNVAPTKVEFYIDGGSPKATVNGSGPSYSTSFDTHSLSNASHAVTAKAYDLAGNVKTSTAVTITVNNPVVPPPDTTPPAVSIGNPANGATISGLYTISATATDAGTGVNKVEFYINGNLVGTDSSSVGGYTYALNTGPLGPGTYTLLVKAYDNATPTPNQSSSTSRSFTVPEVATFIPEDINQDGCVDILDASSLASVFGQDSGAGRNDINTIPPVDILDASLLAAKFDPTCGL